MADVHVLQWVVPFAVALWWMSRWLMHPLAARWRFILGALGSVLMWTYLALTATRVFDAGADGAVVFSATGLAYVCAFLAVVSALALPLGLWLWVEDSPLAPAVLRQQIEP